MVLLEIMNLHTMIAQVVLFLLTGKSVNDSPSVVSCHLHENASLEEVLKIYILHLFSVQ
jgi:hypothetical protein